MNYFKKIPESSSAVTISNTNLLPSDTFRHEDIYIPRIKKRKAIFYSISFIITTFEQNKK